MQGRVGADWGRWFLLYAIVRNSENVKRWCVKPRAFVVIEVGYVSRYIFTENAENHQENQCHLWLQSSRFAERPSTFLKF